MIVLLYVDDLLLACNNLKKLKEVKAVLSVNFEMVDIGEVSFFLGIEVERNRKDRIIRVKQRKYISDILDRFGMSNCKPVSTPLDTKVKLSKTMIVDQKANKIDEVKYQSAIGSLIYAMTATRPGISFAVGVVSQCMTNPTVSH
jgi:Reverse transcriptase (RNA-dependent DNA polymerase)